MGMKRRLKVLVCSMLGMLLGLAMLLPVRIAKAEPTPGPAPVESSPVDTSSGAAAEDPKPVNPDARPIEAKTDDTDLDEAPNPAALQLPISVTGKEVQVASAPTPGNVSVVGAVWDGSQTVATYLRTVTKDGKTTSWQEVDAEPAPVGKNGTSAVTVIDTKSVQVATVSSRPLNVTLSVVDPQASLSARAASTGVQPGLPVIRTRADWGADESLVRSSPTYAQVKGVVVHHTEGANGYSAAQVPAIIRGTYAYHVITRGWNDIGYNVLVDKFGVAWEGRRGGLDKAVQGAHAVNFNHVTFGISLMGSYMTARPTPEALDTISRVIAWKFNLHGVAARGTYTNYGKTYPTITGHRDVQATDCPGTYLYPQLGNIRSKVAGFLAQYQAAAPVVVSAYTAGTKPVGLTTYVWGTAAGGEGARVSVYARVGGRWSLSQSGMVKSNDSYALPLTYGHNTAGQYTFKVVVTNGGKTYHSREVTLTRTVAHFPVTAVSAGKKVVGQATYVWGSAPKARGARVEVHALVAARWSVSQRGTVSSSGSYVLPLTYGADTVGKYRFRVAVTTAAGTAYSSQFDFTRTTSITVASAGTKPVNELTFVWGNVPGAAGSGMSVEVYVNDVWATSQLGAVRSNGSYALPLTYGSNLPGTYRYRVVVGTSVGKYYSPAFELTRT